MYKFNRNRQFSLSDFNQPTGLKMDPENRWTQKAETIPWNEIEEQYASLFPSGTGMPAKPLQTALGSLLIPKQYGYSDRELVEQIRECIVKKQGRIIWIWQNAENGPIKKSGTLSESSCNTLSGICHILISAWNRMMSNSLKNSWNA